jgi:hypothetical protein
MQSQIETATGSKKLFWAGHILSALAGLLLLMDGVMKLIKPAFVVEATVQLGYPESTIFGIGLVLTACTVIYLIPRTAVLGAILLTGYLGGATASHVRAGDPIYTPFFPVIFGAVVWGGLYLRDARVRALVPLRSSPSP